MDRTAISEVNIRRFAAGSWTDSRDAVAVEDPLEIAVAWGTSHKVVSVTMRTPGDDGALALGFLYTEGILTSFGQVLGVEATGGSVCVSLSSEPHLSSVERNFYTTSSCGVCGKASVDAIRVLSPYTGLPGACVRAETLLGLGAMLASRQEVFSVTGGLHASALFDPAGHLMYIREDVGRHNALDKVIGEAFREGRLPLSGYVLLLSGRAGFELIQKAAMAGIRVVVAIGPPSSLALELAREQGMTLVGFLREGKFNVYCGENVIYG